jgi:hypothetical protein
MTEEKQQINVKVKIIETMNRKALEDKINTFINEEVENCDVLDIKLSVDPQVNPEWTNVYPMYLAMIIYR